MKQENVQVRIRKKRQDYQTEEAFKALRTNLQFCGREKKAVAVTSCTPNEGKSTVSLLLAVSLAESGKRTILIDADMRKSVLTGAARPSRKGLLGLAHYLSGQSELEEVISQDRRAWPFTYLFRPLSSQPGRAGRRQPFSGNDGDASGTV